MTDASGAVPDDKRPWHMWAVGIASLLWSAFGAYDYLMTNMQGEAYLKGGGYTAEQIAYFTSFPAWSVGIWAIGVWGAVLASILLLLRKNLAVPVFAVSLGALVVNSVYLYGMAGGMEMMGAAGAGFTVFLIILAGLLWLYSRKMREAGRLS